MKSRVSSNFQIYYENVLLFPFRRLYTTPSRSSRFLATFPGPSTVWGHLVFDGLPARVHSDASLAILSKLYP